MCGSLRPGDLSSTVKTYEYLGSDGGQDGSRIQTDGDHVRQSTNVHAGQKNNTPALAEKTHGQKEV